MKSKKQERKKESNDKKTIAIRIRTKISTQITKTRTRNHGTMVKVNKPTTSPTHGNNKVLQKATPQQNSTADTALPAKTVALDDQGRGPYPTDGKDYFWMADEKKWVLSVPLRDEVTYYLGYIHFDAKTRVVDTVNDIRTSFCKTGVMEYFPKHSRKYQLSRETADRLNAYHLNQAKQELPEGCKLVLITTKTRKTIESFVEK